MSKVKFEVGYGATEEDVKRGHIVNDPTDMKTEQIFPEVLEEEDNSGFLGRRTGLATKRI